LKGFNLSAESFDLLSLGAEHSLLLAFPLLFLAFLVLYTLLKKQQLRIQLAHLAAGQVKVLPTEMC